MNQSEQCTKRVIQISGSPGTGKEILCVARQIQAVNTECENKQASQGHIWNIKEHVMA